MRRPKLIVAALYLAIFLSSPLFFYSISKADRNAQIEIKHKSRDLEKIKSELETKKRESEELEKQTQSLSKEVKQERIKLDQYERSISLTRHKNQDLSFQMAGSKNEIDKIEGEIQEQKGLIIKNIQTYYASSALMGPSSYLPTLTQELIRRQVSQLEGIRENQIQTQETYEEMIETQDALRKELERQRQLYQKSKSQIDLTGSIIQKKMTRREALESELEELNKTASELESLIGILGSKVKEEEEHEKKKRLAKQISGDSPIPSRSLPWPVIGNISKIFGRQKHPELGTPYISNGIIINPGNSQDIQAVSKGTVLFAGPFMSYGPLVLIEHPGDWFSVYGHLGRISVEKGQQVEVGEKVGITGLDKDARHEMYFEIRFYGKPTNPLPWLVSK